MQILCGMTLAPSRLRVEKDSEILWKRVRDSSPEMRARNYVTQGTYKKFFLSILFLFYRLFIYFLFFFIFFSSFVATISHKVEDCVFSPESITLYIFFCPRFSASRALSLKWVCQNPLPFSTLYLYKFYLNLKLIERPSEKKIPI